MIALLLGFPPGALAGPLLDDVARDAARLLAGCGGADLLVGADAEPAERLSRVLALADPEACDPAILQAARALLRASPLPGAEGALAGDAWSEAAEGDLDAVGRGGDPLAGWFSPRLGGEIRGAWGPLRGELAPTAGLDLGGTDELPFGRFDAAWAAVSAGPASFSFGMRDRWWGPARHGPLLLSDAARAFPAGELSAEGRVGRLGRLGALAGLGWLQRPRTDVARPALLLLDLRWAATPWIEVGLSRMALVGGEGRPWPSPGALLLPLDPHVEGDPDAELPDTDEVAAFDLRLALPASRLLGGPVDLVEAWWQYAGEDMIVRAIGPIPVPSLAGVANGIGGTVLVGGWEGTVEVANVLDDRFRWYVGHRIYHEGFTQDGIALGHPEGGDQLTRWFALARWSSWGRLQLEGAWVRRVGAIDVTDSGVLQALATDETTWKGAIRVDAPWTVRWRGGLDALLTARVELATVQGAAFVPGALRVAHGAELALQVGKALARRRARP